MAVEYQLSCNGVSEIPSSEEVNKWVSATLCAIDHLPANVTIRVVDEAEMIELNHRYRGKNETTNVLAFLFEPISGIEYDTLGDIVICFSVVKTESKQQDKPLRSHFAHMVIHGTLHLCGFDHQTDDQAEEMEAVEKGILSDISVC